jgi:hypothetical protein
MKAEEALAIIEVLHEEGAISVSDYNIKKREIIDYIKIKSESSFENEIKVIIQMKLKLFKFNYLNLII